MTRARRSDGLWSPGPPLPDHRADPDDHPRRGRGARGLDDHADRRRRTSADIELYGWVFSAFLLASLLGIAVVGGLIDRLGLVVPFVGGLGLFAHRPA